MKKFRKLADMTAGAMLMLVIMITSQVLARTGAVTTELTYRNIKVYINGAETALTDLNGNIQEPFIAFDTVYVPLSAAARAFGKTSVWNASDNSVNISDGGTAPAVTSALAAKIFNMFDVVQAYEKLGHYSDYEENTSFKMLGDTYKNGAKYRRESLFDYTIDVSYNLNGKYSKIKGVIGYIDGTEQKEGTFRIELDGKLYEEYTFKPNDFPKEITIDVTGVRVMKIISTFNKEFGFGNVTIE